MRVAFTVWACSALVAAWAVAEDTGELTIGEIAIRGDSVTFPILLTGVPDDAVAALDFILEYDPNVLRPVGIQPGPVAQAADKQLQDNRERPGLTKVVLSGINQATLAPGGVAQVQMQQIGNAPNGLTTLMIRDTTFTSPEAEAIPSGGGSWSVDLPTLPSPDDETPGPGLPGGGGSGPPPSTPEEEDDETEEEDPIGVLPPGDPLTRDNDDRPDPVTVEAERLAQAMRDLDRVRMAMNVDAPLEGSPSAPEFPGGPTPSLGDDPEAPLLHEEDAASHGEAGSLPEDGAGQLGSTTGSPPEIDPTDAEGRSAPAAAPSPTPSRRGIRWGIMAGAVVALGTVFVLRRRWLP